jgi:branched-chain amino acid transport system substrate-binding protein
VKKYNIHSESHIVTTALAYDAMMLMAAAIKRAESIDRKKIRDAIANTRSFEGVTGTISFNEHGDPVKSVVFIEIKNGNAGYLKTLKP